MTSDKERPLIKKKLRVRKKERTEQAILAAAEEFFSKRPMDEVNLEEIAEAASLAAYYSKARGSAKVPVNYVRRKHVRKPRRAKAGLVTIDRYKTIMVEPRELQKKELSI